MMTDDIAAESQLLFPVWLWNFTASECENLLPNHFVGCQRSNETIASVNMMVENYKNVCHEPLVLKYIAVKVHSLHKYCIFPHMNNINTKHRNQLIVHTGGPSFLLLAINSSVFRRHGKKAAGKRTKGTKMETQKRDFSQMLFFTLHFWFKE